MRTVLLTVAAVLLASSVAHADPYSTPAEPPPHHHWWGGEPLLVDGAAAALLVGGGALTQYSPDIGTLVMATGVGVYALGTPLVEGHLGHRVHAIVSVAARVVIPLAAGYGLSAYDKTKYTGEDAGLGGLVFGTIGGAALTALIDDLGCTWEAVPYAAPAPSGSGATAGIAGNF